MGGTIHTECVSENPTTQWTMIGLFAFLNLLLLSYGSYLAFVTRNISSAFRESKYIAMSIYNIMICGVLILPIVFIQDVGFLTAFYLRGFGIIFCCSFILGALFGPKLYVIFFLPEKNSPDYFRTFKLEGVKKVETYSPQSESGNERPVRLQPQISNKTKQKRKNKPKHLKLKTQTKSKTQKP